jgi:hypothetical protein
VVMDPVLYPDVKEVPRMSLQEEEEQEEDFWTVIENKKPRRSLRKTRLTDRYFPLAWSHIGGLGEVAGPHHGQVRSLQAPRGLV